MDGQCLKAIGKQFDWMTKKKLDEVNVTQIPEDSDTGYMLEVKLFHPPGIHDENNDLPVAPESKAISEEELSPHTRHLREKIKLKGNPKEKLIPYLHDTRNTFSTTAT